MSTSQKSSSLPRLCWSLFLARAVILSRPIGQGWGRGIGPCAFRLLSLLSVGAGFSLGSPPHPGLLTPHPHPQGLEKKSTWVTQHLTHGVKRNIERHSACMHCVLVCGDGGAILSQPLSFRRWLCSALQPRGELGPGASCLLKGWAGPARSCP